MREKGKKSGSPLKYNNKITQGSEWGCWDGLKLSLPSLLSVLVSHLPQQTRPLTTPSSSLFFFSPCDCLGSYILISFLPLSHPSCLLSFSERFSFTASASLPFSYSTDHCYRAQALSVLTRTASWGHRESGSGRRPGEVADQLFLLTATISQRLQVMKGK